jgi:hypothetical protein
MVTRTIVWLYAVLEAGERVCGVEKTVWMRDRVDEE